jgi:hypothetical protein
MNTSLHPADSERCADGAGRWRVACMVCAIVALGIASGRLAAPAGLQLEGHGEVVDLLVIAAVVAYVLAMALPFVPGIEIGLALMLVLGWDGILLVYLCTQVGLALSFAVGRIVPARTIAAGFGWLRLERAQRMVEELDRTPPAQRVELLARRSSPRWLAALFKHRYLALALALNLPGNAVLGGAGGIGMIAGLSRAYRFPCFVLLVAAATTPVPLFLSLKDLG